MLVLVTEHVSLALKSGYHRSLKEPYRDECQIRLFSKNHNVIPHTLNSCMACSIPVQIRTTASRKKEKNCVEPTLHQKAPTKIVMMVISETWSRPCAYDLTYMTLRL